MDATKDLMLTLFGAVARAATLPDQEQPAGPAILAALGLTGRLATRGHPPAGAAVVAPGNGGLTVAWSDAQGAHEADLLPSGEPAILTRRPGGGSVFTRHPVPDGADPSAHAARALDAHRAGVAAIAWDGPTPTPPADAPAIVATAVVAELNRQLAGANPTTGTTTRAG